MLLEAVCIVIFFFFTEHMLFNQPVGVALKRPNCVFYFVFFPEQLPGFNFN